MTAPTENIKVRRVDFDVSKIIRYYSNNNIFGTHYINAMHIVFPEGEKFFIRSAKRYLDQIKNNPTLVDRVKKFIGQEGVHHKEHEKFWNILEGMGLKPYRLAKIYDTIAFKYLENGLFKLLPKKRAELLALSVTTAAEHFTALLGDGGLRSNPFGDLSPDVKLLLQWHCAEELEHKSVCFDLYQEVGGDYNTRVAGMVIASVLLWFFLFGGQMYFVANDKEKDWKKIPSDFFEFWKAFLNSEGVNNIGKMYLDYYKKDFHPDDHDNYQLAEDFFKEHQAYFEKMGVAV
ncbi:MAG: metal-dependent hydrolase [Bacteroidetes bacterium]|nr:metal-dependent hydrolase [Bacteroidota bacterium]